MAMVIQKDTRKTNEQAVATAVVMAVWSVLYCLSFTFLFAHVMRNVDLNWC